MGLPLLTPVRAGNCPWKLLVRENSHRSTVNNSDILDSPFQFFEARLPGTAGRARFPAKIIPPQKHTFCLFRVSRILFILFILLLGAVRINGIAFRSFRKRNMFQKNTITVYSEYSYSGIVPKERALRFRTISWYSHDNQLISR